MDAPDYEGAIVEGAEAIASALARDPERSVGNCPGWDLAQLAGHVGSLYQRVAEQVRSRSPEAVHPSDIPSPPTGGARVEWLREAAKGLMEAFASAEDAAPAGRWRDRAITAGLWRRRMAHETVIHRVDAEDAFGDDVVLDGGLAVDGIDEVLELFIPFSTAKEGWPPSDPLWLVRNDGSQHWWVRPGTNGVEVLSQPPDGLAGSDSESFARVDGTAAELLLTRWKRRKRAASAVAGSVDVLEQWLAFLGW